MPLTQSVHYVFSSVGRDSSVSIVTMGWMVQGSNPSGGGVRISAPVQTGPGAYPASCTVGTGSFPGVKQPGRGVDHPPPSSAEVRERVQLHICSPSGPSWPVLGWTLLYVFNSAMCFDVEGSDLWNWDLGSKLFCISSYALCTSGLKMTLWERNMLLL